MPVKITFDPVTHTYRDPAGAIWPGVTGVLRDAGLVDTAWFTEYGRSRGVAAHAAIELDISGELDESTVAPDIAGHLKAFRKFRRETGIVIESNEKQIQHDQYRYAGKADVIGTIKGKRYVVDFKTGDVAPWTALQLAAYATAEKIKHRMAVHLKEDGTYKAEVYSELELQRDFAVFIAALTVANWKRKQKKGK